MNTPSFDDMDRSDFSEDRLDGAKEIRECYARQKSLAWTYRRRLAAPEASTDPA